MLKNYICLNYYDFRRRALTQQRTWEPRPEERHRMFSLKLIYFGQKTSLAVFPFMSSYTDHWSCYECSTLPIKSTKFLYEIRKSFILWIRFLNFYPPPDPIKMLSLPTELQRSIQFTFCESHITCNQCISFSNGVLITCCISFQFEQEEMHLSIGEWMTLLPKGEI